MDPTVGPTKAKPPDKWVSVQAEKALNLASDGPLSATGPAAGAPWKRPIRQSSLKALLYIVSVLLQSLEPTGELLKGFSSKSIFPAKS